MPAFLIGSIGVLAETSDIQRQAFNAAFAEAGLDWNWSQDEYAKLLRASGGKQRIAEYASARGEEVDAAAIHARKSALFQDALAKGLSPRDGVKDTLEAAKGAGWQIGFVTGTSAGNVEAILTATGIERALFDIVTDADAVQNAKPAPDIYRHALDQLGADAAASIAVEDNPDGVASAKAAGLTCLAFPGALHTASDFSASDRTVTRLSPDDIPTSS